MAILVECSRCGLWVPVVYEWREHSHLCLGCWLKKLGDDVQHNRVPPAMLYAIGVFAEHLQEEEDAETAT